MSEITGGELLARCLANEGVRFVFGLPCPEVDPLLAALPENEIRFVPVRHEAAGAHMAEGLGPALERAKAEDGPSVLCVRTDREANLATPSGPLLRFLEVYQGPLG